MYSGIVYHLMENLLSLDMHGTSNSFPGVMLSTNNIEEVRGPTVHKDFQLLRSDGWDLYVMELLRWPKGIVGEFVLMESSTSNQDALVPSYIQDLMKMIQVSQERMQTLEDNNRRMMDIIFQLASSTVTTFQAQLVHLNESAPVVTNTKGNERNGKNAIVWMFGEKFFFSSQEKVNLLDLGG
ncbi:Uncharacterized protein TCM_028971 [Theobroma cacao]|uniref:Uncharacterized protein n=1 Tax=Theobroma cacao TaxID=3641 RepID=A0A061GAU1_THECC|nr:Uncharacterized protein TCM_028971 [Theobroma cacao]